MSIKFPNLKRFFSPFLATVMMVSLLAVNAHAADRRKITDYGDAYGHWAYKALAWAVDNGVLVGMSEDKCLSLFPKRNLQSVIPKFHMNVSY
ncbi:MAG: hypothetical protein HFF48_09970 [Lawsonibacter sp.]|jgi:hypothetical protein|nr:hypothetical protein [Lawsonibacter sp.]